MSASDAREQLRVAQERQRHLRILRAHLRRRRHSRRLGRLRPFLDQLLEFQQQATQVMLDHPSSTCNSEAALRANAARAFA